MLKLNKKIHGKVTPFFELFIQSALALFVVWFLNGLWHGASTKYIVYGLYYYVFNSANELLGHSVYILNILVDTFTLFPKGHNLPFFHQHIRKVPFTLDFCQYMC